MIRTGPAAMRRKLFLSTFALALVLGVLGCDRNEKTVEDDEQKPRAEETEEEPSSARESDGAEGRDSRETDASETEDSTGGEETAEPEETSPAMEAFDPEELPETVDTEHLYEKAGLSWTDDSGDNLLVFTLRESEGSREGKRTGILVAAHWRRAESGAWSKIRDFREIIENCGLDMFLFPEVGPWSLTDFDEDGTKEISFAWSAGCRGGLDPLDHKVIVTEDGDKSILRGSTAMPAHGPGGKAEVRGGEIDEVEGFDSEKRREQAQKVWEATAGR